MQAKRSWVALAVGLVGLAIPAPASGAVTIGSNLSPGPFSNPCPSTTCTTGNTTLPGQAVTSPIDGVVVRWRVRIVTFGSTPLQLKVIRLALLGGAYTGVSTSATQTLGGGMGDSVVAFDTQQPIRTGDQIALSIAGAAPGVAAAANQAGVTYVRWDPPLADGETRPPSTLTADNLEILVNADIEPDCDSDGLGDETQDPDILVCDTVAPDTIITKGPKDKVRTKKRKAKVSFEFAASEPGASLLCSLDGRPLEPCTSPHTEKVRKGHHIFAVGARDAAGNLDPTAATDEFTVKRKKKRKR